MQILLVFLAWGLFAWSLLTVVRTPSYRLWKAGVAATEWGHWLGWMAAAIALAGAAVAMGKWIFVPALSAAGLFHSPVLRAARRSRTLRSELDRAFETIERDSVGRPAPFLFKDLPHIPLPSIEKQVHVYRRIDGLELELDLYRQGAQASVGPSPLVLVVHGGSWSSGDSSQLSGMNRYLAGRGYAVAAINYRLAPRFRFPSQLEDIRAALGFLEGRRSELGVDTDRTVLVGRSSGGHLALLAAYGTRSIRGVAALYSPTDLVWSWHRPAPKRIMDSNAVISDFLGGGLEAVPDRFVRASPIQCVREDSPPTLLIHGGQDELVSPLQSRRLAAELERVGVTCFHLELPWGKHGMDANLAGPGGQMTLYALERFLEFTLRGPGSRAETVRNPAAADA